MQVCSQLAGRCLSSDLSTIGTIAHLLSLAPRFGSDDVTRHSVCVSAGVGAGGGGGGQLGRSQPALLRICLTLICTLSFSVTNFQSKFVTLTEGEKAFHLHLAGIVGHADGAGGGPGGGAPWKQSTALQMHRAQQKESVPKHCESMFVPRLKVSSQAPRRGSSVSVKDNNMIRHSLSGPIIFGLACRRSSNKPTSPLSCKSIIHILSIVFLKVESDDLWKCGNVLGPVF